MLLKFNGFFYITSSLFFLVIKSYPIDETDFELSANYFEGDMILSDELQKLLENTVKSKRKTRNAIINMDQRWPNGIVYFAISNEFSASKISLIHDAMEHIMLNTCIRFIEINLKNSKLLLSNTNFVFIRSSEKGCSAAVGNQRKGMQYINLVPIGCFRFGIIVHELLHTLGFFHQHSSTDRDHYVHIRMENIRPGMEFNFRKLPPEFSSSFGVGYDFASIMHYKSFAFSWNGKPTIEPLNKFAFEIMGQRNGLSEKDILKIQRMYNCK